MAGDPGSSRTRDRAETCHMQADRSGAASRERTPEASSTLVVIAVTAALYTVLGRVSLLLAIPPSLGPMFWPAAGISLAAVLIYGVRAWPGVWLGAFVTNVLSELDWPLGIATVVSPAMIASGATLQALAGLWFTRRFLPRQLRLEHGREILRFAVGVGPVCSLVSATIGSASLTLLYDLPVANTFLFTWLTWWVGDLIGVAIATPIALCFLAAPAPTWRPRLRTVAAPMSGVVLVIAAFAARACDWEQDHLRTEIARRGDAIQQRLGRDLDAAIANLESVRSFILSSDEVTPSDFRTFGLRLLSRTPGARELAWCVRQSTGTTLTTEGKRAGIHPFVVRCVEPAFGGQLERGTEVTADPVRRAMMERSARLDAVVATPPLGSGTRDGGSRTVWLTLAIGEPDGVGRSDASLATCQGFVLLAIDPERVLSRSLLGHPDRGGDVSLADTSDAASPIPIRAPSGPARNDRDSSRRARAPFVWSANLEFAGRRWTLSIDPILDRLIDLRTWQTWSVLVIGALFSVVIGGFLLSQSGRAAAIGQLVAKRTADLVIANEEARLRASQLLSVNRKLAASNRELELFAYVASHDLKEPLRMVACFTGLLEKRLADRLVGEEREYMGFAIDGARRSQQLVDDLLTYARLGRSDATLTATDLGEIVAEVLADLAPAIAAAGADVAVGPLPTVFGNRTQVRQLLQNLITNSLKFHGADRPTVRITGSTDGSMATIVVADRGIGIAPEYHERIFGLFQRLHSREEYPGTGIGLAVCKKIVEQHGGTLRVESDVGRGAAFHFTLPVPEAEEPVAPYLIPRGGAQVATARKAQVSPLQTQLQS